MTVPWGLRRPDARDLADLLGLMEDPRSIHRRVACRHREEPEAESQLLERLLHDQNLVLEDPAGPIALASWQAFGDHVHLNVMVVAGHLQRRGIGAALYDAFVREAAAGGARTLSLRAYVDSPWALAFYDHRGLHRWQSEAAVPRGFDGLMHFLGVAAAHGQWPDDAKVLFYGALPSQEGA